MNIDILAFGIAKDIVGKTSTSLELEGALSITELKELLCERYPDFAKIKSFALAVNQEYQEDEYLIQSQDEIAIIPPVSGG